MRKSAASRRQHKAGRPVVLVGLGLVAVQLGFRAWAVFGSWFQFDDFAFLSRVMNERLGADLLLGGYGGHLMPGGFLLTSLFAHHDALDFRYPAGALLTFQAVASIGCLVMLRHLFRSRWGILAPLAVYLYSAISLPAFIWWAAGVNQLPLQIAFFWGMTLHVSYLRTRRVIFAVATALVMVAALLFYEKTLLVYGAILIVTMGYFATGSLTDRVKQVLTRYRFAVLLHIGTAATYVAVYVRYGLDTGPGTSVRAIPFFELTKNLVLESFSTGIVGGPLAWEPLSGPFQLVNPSPVVVLLAVAALVALVVHVDRSRDRSRRAWLVPAWFLTANLTLISLTRAAALGPIVGLEYRYQTELPAAFALALALATLPLRDAAETVAPKVPSALLDRHEWVVALGALCSSLALVSSYQYANHWREARQSRTYFTNVQHDVRTLKHPLPAVSVSVPQYLLWGYRYPENTTEHVLRMFDRSFRYPSITLDELYVVGDDGHVAPVGITPMRAAVPATESCGYRFAETAVRIPLDGPVDGGGFWVRMAYFSKADTPAMIEAGSHTYRTTLTSGLHNIYFRADGQFQDITVWGVHSEARVCMQDLSLGFPAALPASDNS